MLDPSNDFNSPCYDDTFRRNYFFKEYKNFTEYFIELDYWIMREAFVSRIGSALNLEQTHYDDSGAAEKIFRDISQSDRETFAARNYFVGDETIDIGTSKFGDIYHVTELYVYAPQTTFKTSTTEVVNFPQLVDFDYAYSKAYSFNSLQFLCGLEEVGFASSDLSLGDEFYIERPEQRVGGTNFYACRSSMLTVSRREGAYVWAKASSFTNPYSANVWTAKAVIFDCRNVSGGVYYIKSPTKTYATRALQVVVRKETTFSAYNRRALFDKFAPKDPLTGIEVGQIDSGSNPTFSTYKSMMKNGNEIHSSPTVETEVFKNLWQYDDFYTPAK
jgi:hypothetical protein